MSSSTERPADTSDEADAMSGIGHAVDSIAAAVCVASSMHGWAWIMRDCDVPAATSKQGDAVSQEWDGAYLAACPGCGQDVTWNAVNGEPICTCAQR